MRRFVVFLVVSFVLLSGCVEEPGPGVQPCTLDAKVCPDGSTVARDPSNNCLFPECPAVGPQPEYYDVAPDPVTGMVSLTDSSRRRLFDNVVSRGDSALADLAGVSSLEYLDLSYSSVSDISSLPDLPGLREINLSFTSVSDVSPLAGLTSLEAVNLSNSNVSDLSALAGLPNLRRLWATSCSISDVSSLRSMSGLKQVNLKYNPVPSLVCDSLKGALPSADVYC